MKRYTIIAILTIGIILGFFTGVYLYRINKINNEQIEYTAEKVEDECTIIGKLDEEELQNLISTNSNEEKTSPNCVLTLKIYYEKARFTRIDSLISNGNFKILFEEIKNNTL